MVNWKTCVVISLLSFLVGVFGFNSYNPVLAHISYDSCVLGHIGKANSNGSAALVRDTCRQLNPAPPKYDLSDSANPSQKPQTLHRYIFEDTGKPAE